MPDIDTRHGRQWLDTAKSRGLQSVSASARTEETRPSSDGRGGWAWLDNLNQPDISQPVSAHNSRTRLRRWIAAGFAAASLTTGAIIAIAGAEADPAASQTASATSSRAVMPGPCAGLSAPVVTDADGDATSLTGVIAAFEHAYYQRRDAAVALTSVAPEAGLALDALAAGIASIPAGTGHCVAITPIADSAAEVHLVEHHPDGHRIDYLQLINTRADGERVLITNVQKRG
ncbi:hypothetical protein [Nocardia sp. NPDC057227]|uniref:hypothetical protein n=1 Tax=Nocardia sp. NPDC057227 TaxID=3346056 RepID=UPI00363B2BF6